MAILPYLPPPEGTNPTWWPINGQQRTALESPAKLLLYGGGSGGGKTDFLVADAAQEVSNPNFRGVLLRKSFREMVNIIDRMKAIHRPLGGRPTEKDTVWKYPSGAQIRLGYLAEDKDIENYQGTPFSWLGIDEAGNQIEKRVRRILPWLASTDPTLRVRARFSANPGGVGADWLMKLFLRDKCPIHNPEESVVPGAIYGGKRLTWSDGKEVGMTVSFIPALVGDNPLYGEEKIAVLRSQEGAIAEKLLEGCWCELAGRYYSFLNESFRKPLAENPAEYWNTHVISIDYGFGESWAAAGLYYITEPTLEFPDGRMFKIAEYIGVDEESGEKMGSEDFAKEIVKRFVRGGRRQITAAFCDPANDGHTGNGRSNMEIMGEVLSEEGISLTAAHKDRVSNFQNLYRMLKKGQVVITDACPLTFKSLNSRMHDPARSGDIKKIKGSPLDDLLDETAYAANTYFLPSSKPKEVSNAERLATLRASGLDEHSLSIHAMRMMMEQHDDDAPVRISRVGATRVISR
jgi:hypothetical protein